MDLSPIANHLTAVCNNAVYHSGITLPYISVKAPDMPALFQWTEEIAKEECAACTKMRRHTPPVISRFTLGYRSRKLPLL